MAALALLLLVSALAHGLARLVGVPSVPLLLVAGALLTAVGATEAPALTELLQLGLAFLMFSAGLEVAPHRAGPQLRTALTVGVLQFVLMGGVGYAAGMALGLTPPRSCW